jgi:hypothetical protein
VTWRRNEDCPVDYQLKKFLIKIEDGVDFGWWWTLSNEVRRMKRGRGRGRGRR